MSWQLIYTSAPRGLSSGQSGFCTVARSADLREALIKRLEQISSYHYLRVAEAATAHRNPTISAFRVLDLRGAKYYVLTRIQPCGLDFTSRTNHLAHHLVFQPDELAALPSPAAILRYWPGWLTSWQGEPRPLEDLSPAGFAVAAKSCLPAQTWLRLTGDAGRAAGLLESECVRGCYLVCPPESEQQVLDLFCETLQLLNLNGQYALRPWRHPFTTFLQAEDNPSDFQLRACQEGTPAYQQAVQRTATMIPLRSVRIPANSLVKAAREGQKPPRAASATSPAANLTLQRQTVGRKPSALELTDTGHWRKPAARPERPPLLDISFSIKSASLARLGIFAAVLLSLLLAKHWLGKKPVAPENAPPPAPAHAESHPAKPESRAPVPGLASRTRPAPEMALGQAALKGLSGDEPTYVFIAGNLTNFSLPINAFSRFQNLLHKFDSYQALPKDIHLSLNTDEWDFKVGVPFTVNGLQKHVFSSTNATGLECAFDYSIWINNPDAPVSVQTTFAVPPGAFSIHFGFSTPENGDPFRLLIVNESNPPVPLPLPLQWLNTNGENLAASLQLPLGQLLSGQFILPPGCEWRLQPFIRTKSADKAAYLYKDWPAQALPRPWRELDFATAKHLLQEQLGPLKAKPGELALKMKQQTEQAGLDRPLGRFLGISDENLASFADFAPKPGLEDFINYLNRLRRKSRIKGWPHIAEEETDMGAEFQQIYDRWVEKFPEARSELTIGNASYFSVVWQKLKEIDQTRQEQQRANNEVDELQRLLSDVPATLDKVAYVGLFIIDPPKPSLEMIRFQTP